MSEEYGRPRRAGEFTLLLPGSWALLPMSSKEEVSKEAAKIAKSRVPKGDRFAALRMQARRELEKSGFEALNAGSTFYALATEILPGVPFSASMMGAAPGWPEHAQQLATSAERLAATVPDGVDVEHPTGLLRRRTSKVVQKPGETEITSLDIEYWLVRDDGPPAVFFVSVPMAQESDQAIIDFFDAVVGSAIWSDQQRYFEVAAPGEPGSV